MASVDAKVSKKNSVIEDLKKHVQSHDNIGFTKRKDFFHHIEHFLNKLRTGDIFTLLIISTFLFNAFIYRNQVVLFVMLIVLYIIYDFGNYDNLFSDRDRTIADSLRNDIEANLLIHKDDSRFYLQDTKIYRIYRNPKKVKFIYKNFDIVEFLYDIRFIKQYDQAAYYRIIIYLEYFLKIYYKILTCEYNCINYFDIISELRNEILNTLNYVKHNLPQMVENTQYSLNEEVYRKYGLRIDKYFNFYIKKIRSMLYTKIKILTRKADSLDTKKTFDYKGPYPNDIEDDKHYELYV